MHFHVLQIVIVVSKVLMIFKTDDCAVFIRPDDARLEAP